MLRLKLERVALLWPAVAAVDLQSIDSGVVNVHIIFEVKT